MAGTSKGRDYDVVEGVRGVVGFDGAGVDGKGSENWDWSLEHCRRRDVIVLAGDLNFSSGCRKKYCRHLKRK